MEAVVFEAAFFEHSFFEASFFESALFGAVFLKAVIFEAALFKSRLLEVVIASKLPPSMKNPGIESNRPPAGDIKWFPFLRRSNLGVGLGD